MTDIELPSFFRHQKATLVPMAPRRTPGRVVFFDNGRLDPSYGHFEAIFDALRAEFARRAPSADIDLRAARLSAHTIDQVAHLADDLVGAGYDAAVIALCDIGVSRPSALLAADLESRGVACTLITSGIGATMVRNTLEPMGRYVPLTDVRATRLTSREGVLAEIGELGGSLYASIAERVTPPEWHASPDLETELSERLASLAVPVSAAAHNALDFSRVMEEFGLSDGLPLVTPTTDRIEWMLSRVPAHLRSEVIWPAVPPRQSPVTTRDVAIVSTLAGCKPEWLWTVVAAYRAMAAPEFSLSQGSITTHPCGTFVLVSGPRAAESGIESGAGCLGPGFPANATIGRAVSLAYRVFMGAVPGTTDLTRQGSPAEYSYCCAEAIDASPWPGYHADIAGEAETVVTVLRCEGPRNVLDQVSTLPTALLDTFADGLIGLGSNNSYNPGAQCVVLMNPEHAHLLSDAGWQKADVQRYLFERARLSVDDLIGRGSLPRWPVWYRGLDRVPIVETPDDFIVIVAGGSGPQSQVAIPWGYSRGMSVLAGSEFTQAPAELGSLRC
jgi:hypothetical protein